jgi:acyl dehydratase
MRCAILQGDKEATMNNTANDSGASETTGTATRVVRDVDELKTLVGQELGVSQWVEITQERVNTFAEATGDFQYIHVDPERATQTFFGGTVAHGFLTLSLSHYLRGLTEGVQIDLGGKLIVNYGLNKVRFPAPVPVGKRIRMRVQLLEVEDVSGGVQIGQLLTYEVEGSDKPACVAETLIRVYF